MSSRFAFCTDLSGPSASSWYLKELLRAQHLLSSESSPSQMTDRSLYVQEERKRKRETDSPSFFLFLFLRPALSVLLYLPVYYDVILVLCFSS